MVEPGQPADGSARSATLELSIIGCAFNEEATLPRFLQSVLTQTGPSYRLREVIIVASGCTDGTVDRLREWADRDARVRPVVQGVREGKAAALAAGLRVARGEAILLANVDTLPVPGAIEALTQPLLDPGVGLCCARFVPSRIDRGFSARLGRLIWELHDLASQELPKSAGAISFRSGAIELPVDIEDDDTFLGILLGRQRGRSAYAREAVFLLNIPSNPADLLRQRYRFTTIPLGLYQRTGMLTSTWRPGLLARCLARYLHQRPREAFLLGVLVLFELGVRTAAVAGHLTGRAPLIVWAPVRSTKGAIDPIASEP